MALAVNGNASNATTGSGGTTLAVSITSVSGEGLAVHISDRSTVSSVTDDGGNTWVQGPTNFLQTVHAEIWYCLSASPVTTVTVTTAAASQIAATVIRFSGHDTTVIDVSANNKATGLSASVSLTTTNADDLIFAGANKISAGSLTLDAGPAFTDLGDNPTTTGGSGVDNHAAYKIVAATGTYTPSWTVDQSRAWAAVGIAFQQATGGGTQFTQTVSVTQGSTLTMSNQVGKLLAFSQGTALTLAKLVGKSLAFTSGSALSLAKRVTKTLTATAGSTLALAASRLFLKTISVTASSTLSLVVGRAFLKTISVAAGSTLTLTKRVGKLLSFTASTTPTLKRLIAKTIPLTASSAVTTSKRVAKALAITAASSATLTKQIAKTLNVTASSLLGFVKQFIAGIVVVNPKFDPPNDVTVSKPLNDAIVNSSQGEIRVLKSDNDVIINRSTNTAWVVKDE